MIELSQITKVFDARGIAGLHGISLSLKKGEILALMGPNGSGKSTILNIVSGKLSPDAGQIKTSGNLHLIDDKKAFPVGNVLKYLTSAVSISRDEEKKIQLARDLADIFEFTSQLKQNVQDLSQGQKQKVLLSSELINFPEIILLDEPFNHLDPFSRKQILSGLFKFIKQQSSTVVWVTHDRNEALYFADQVAVINFGKIEQITSPSEIVKHPKNLFVAQFIGFKNFILCTKSNDQWMTPWGLIPSQNRVAGEEALLVIPDYAWKEESGPFEVQVLKVSPHNLQWEIEFNWKEQYFVGHFPLSHSDLTKKNKLSLIPMFDECFIISL